MLYLWFVLMLVGYLLSKDLWMRWNYDLHKIPAPPTFPFLGHTLHFLKARGNVAINTWLQDWRTRLNYPKLIRFCTPGSTNIMITDAALARTVFVPRTGDFKRGGALYKQFHRLLTGEASTKCMFTTHTTTSYVKTIRRTYADSFTFAGLKQIFQKQVEVMENGVEYLEKRSEEIIDIQHFFSRLILDAAGKAELDVDFGALDNSSPLCNLLITCGHHLRTLGTIPILDTIIKLFPGLKFARRIHQDFEDLKKEWTKISEEVSKRGELDIDNLSFAANLKRVCDPDTNEPLPLNILTAELATAVVGAFDTSSHQIAWIFAFLSTHPHVTDRLIQELENCGLSGPKSAPLTLEVLSELEYLSAVVKESLRRIHIMLFVHSRVTTRDTIIAGYRVPKGITLYLCGNMTMNCEPEWTEHLSFKPERWLNEKINISEKYYIPFGIGERDCPGLKLAMQSMKLAIVYFITRFRFELVGDSIETLLGNATAGVVFEAGNGINMKITPRM